jgi:hypothetical protein
MARPTRPPITVPDPPKVTRETRFTARTALAATASRRDRAGDIDATLTRQKNAKGPTGGWLVLLQNPVITKGGVLVMQAEDSMHPLIVSFK